MGAGPRRPEWLAHQDSFQLKRLKVLRWHASVRGVRPDVEEKAVPQVLVQLRIPRSPRSVSVGDVRVGGVRSPGLGRRGTRPPIRPPSTPDTPGEWEGRAHGVVYDELPTQGPQPLRPRQLDPLGPDLHAGEESAGTTSLLRADHSVPPPRSSRRPPWPPPRNGCHHFCAVGSDSRYRYRRTGCGGLGLTYSSQRGPAWAGAWWSRIIRHDICCPWLRRRRSQDPYVVHPVVSGPAVGAPRVRVWELCEWSTFRVGSPSGHCRPVSTGPGTVRGQGSVRTATAEPGS